MNAHQKRGFEFLWRNIAGSLIPDEMEASSRSHRVGGCVIAHAPGTGKSLMIISFLQSYLSLFPACKPLIIAPKSMLHTWKREFNKWNVNIPVYILSPLREFTTRESPFRGPVMAMSCKAPIRQVYNIYSIKMLHEWHKKESVLIMSYSLFYTFSNEDNDKMSEETRQIGRYLRMSPGLLILDEGHIPRSHNSKIWNLLMRVNTRLRILLSGTLFQNNFEEYFNTLCLARPTFVDRVLQLKNHQSEVSEDVVKEKIARRYFVEQILKRINTGRSRERSACRQLLKSMTEDFIDVYKGDILNELPGLRTYTVMLRPTPLQETLFRRIHEIVHMKNSTCSNVELEMMISIASIHPCLLKDLVFIEKYWGVNHPDLEVGTCRKDHTQGIKLKFVVDIIRLCCEKGEKALVFCQYIAPLQLLEEILEFHFHWCKGQEILLLKGKHHLHERQGIIDKFSQHPGKARVLLASIKACGMGINLTEASRVILLDLVWNPSCTKQAIGRAFRIGQKKVVHVYQLVAHGTLEEEKCRKADWKELLSSLIYVGENSGGDHIGQHVQQQALQIEDDMLKQLVVKDHMSVFQRIFKHEDIHKQKRQSCDVDDILHFQ